MGAAVPVHPLGTFGVKLLSSLNNPSDHSITKLVMRSTMLPVRGMDGKHERVRPGFRHITVKLTLNSSGELDELFACLDRPRKRFDHGVFDREIALADAQAHLDRRAGPITFGIGDVGARCFELLLEKFNQRFAKCLFVAHAG